MFGQTATQKSVGREARLIRAQRCVGAHPVSVVIPAWERRGGLAGFTVLDAKRYEWMPAGVVPFGLEAVQRGLRRAAAVSPASIFDRLMRRPAINWQKLPPTTSLFRLLSRWRSTRLNLPLFRWSFNDRSSVVPSARLHRDAPPPRGSALAHGPMRLPVAFALARNVPYAGRGVTTDSFSCRWNPAVSLIGLLVAYPGGVGMKSGIRPCRISAESA